MLKIDDFSPDIFSKDKPIFSDIDRKKSDEIKTVFNAWYGYLEAEITIIKKFGGLEINSNNFLIETNKGVYILKTLKRTDSFKLDILEKQSTLMTWLFQSHLPCPLPIKNMKETYVCEVEDKWVSLMTFVPGLYFSGGEADNIMGLGEAVGLFHAQLKCAPNEFIPSRQYPQLSDLDKEMFDAVVCGAQDRLSLFPEEDKKLLIDNKSFLAEIWAKVLDYQNEFIESEKSLTHIDLHPHNVLMNDGKVAAFLDFDSLMWAPLKMMLGFSAYKLLRQSISMKINRISKQEIRGVLDEYLEGVYKYLPELRTEKKVLALFACTEICRRIAHILRLNIQENNIEWNHVLAIQISGLKEVIILFDS